MDRENVRKVRRDLRVGLTAGCAGRYKPQPVGGGTATHAAAAGWSLDSVRTCGYAAPPQTAAASGFVDSRVNIPHGRRVTGCHGKHGLPSGFRGTRNDPCSIGAPAAETGQVEPCASLLAFVIFYIPRTSCAAPQPTPPGGVGWRWSRDTKIQGEEFRAISSRRSKVPETRTGRQT